jgi:hypothetical protein
VMGLSLKSLPGKAIDNLDVTLAALGGVLAIPLTIYFRIVIGNPIYTMGGVIVFLVCLAYLLLRRRSPTFALVQAEAAPRMYLLLNILFFCLLTYSIAAFYLRPELYTRPLGYFVALAAMAAVLAIEILFLPLRKSAAYFALFKIIVIGLNLAWSQLLIYPSLVGADPWYHQMFTLKILHAGHIPSGYHQYSQLPTMHLMIGGTMLITGLDYKMATMFSVSLLQVVCNIMFIFLLGKFIHSAKAGLLAALSVGTANYFIQFSYTPVPNTMGVVFIPIIIYLLFKLRQEKPKVSICLSVLFIAAVLLTHTVATVMLVAVLFLIWLAFELYKRLRYQAAERAWVFLVVTLVLTAAGLSYWARDPFIWRNLSDLVRAFEAALLRGFAPLPGNLTPLQAAVVQYQTHVVPVSEQLFNQLGLFSFYGLAFVGSFAMLGRSLRNRYGFALVIASLLILAANFFVILPFQSWLVPRINHLLQILLAIPVGTAFLWLASLPGRKIASACLIGTIVFALSFLMVMSPQLNRDNRTFSANTIVRYAFTESELQAFDTASTFYDGEIGIDGYGVRPLQLTLAPSNEISSIDDQLFSRDYGDCRDMLVMIRKEVVVNPWEISDLGPFRLDYDPRQALMKQGFSEVYDNGLVSGFVA